MTVRQYPVLLRRVEEQAQDIEVNGMLLKACPFIWTDENSALYLWVAKHHYLKYRGPDEGYGIRRGRERQRYSHLAAIYIKKTVIWCQDGACKRSDGEIKATGKCWPSVCWSGRRTGNLKLSLSPLCRWVYCRCFRNQRIWTQTKQSCCMLDWKHPLEIYLRQTLKLHTSGFGMF